MAPGDQEPNEKIPFPSNRNTTYFQCSRDRMSLKFPYKFKKFEAQISEFIANQLT